MNVSQAACRSCAADGLVIILSLGKTPLANSLLTAKQLDEPEPTYALDLAFCPCCSLVQITETVSPEELFSEYLYFSSFSDTMVGHARAVAEQLIETRDLNSESLIIEIASNDGYLLQHYKKAGVPVLGIEPAANIALVAVEKRGIPTLCKFFNSELALKLREEGRLAEVIHANNVLAHVADLGGVVRGIHLLLKDNGVAVIEVPYVKEMIDNCEFDTIYHEHLCYFSLTALNHLFRRHELFIQAVERLPIHGGSLRVFVGKGDERSESVERLLQEEEKWGVNRFEFYQDFSARVEKLREDLLAILEKLKAEGKRIAAYGASAKGSTLLNYCHIGRETLDFVVDRSTVKQGYYTPGTHLPIYAPEKLLDEMPSAVLLLTWNFADEILRQQEMFRRKGGRFIIPIPDVRIV
jgi:SAM-dependent methyltransferase